MKTLKGMTWDHARGYDPMVATSTAFCAQRPGLQIHWEKRPLQAFADRPIEQMADEFDLMVIDHPHVGEVAASGYLTPLDRPGREEDLKTLSSQTVGASHASYEFDGRQWGLAIDAAAPVAAIRGDKLAHAPSDLRQVLDLAERGEACLALAPINALMTFFGLARNLDIDLASDPGQLIDVAEAVDVLDRLCELSALVDPRCFEFDPIAVYEWMSSDPDAPAYSAFGYGYTNYSRDGYSQYPLTFHDAPGFDKNGPRGTVLGGAGIAVSSASRYLEDAVDFAFFVASADCQSGLFFDAGGQPANAVAWDDAGCNAMSRNFFRNTRATLESAWVRPRYDGYMALQDQGSGLVHACLRGDLTSHRCVERLNAVYRKTRGA